MVLHDEVSHHPQNNPSRQRNGKNTEDADIGSTWQYSGLFRPTTASPLPYKVESMALCSPQRWTKGATGKEQHLVSMDWYLLSQGCLSQSFRSWRLVPFDAANCFQISVLTDLLPLGQIALSTSVICSSRKLKWPKCLPMEAGSK